MNRRLSVGAAAFLVAGSALALEVRLPDEPIHVGDLVPVELVTTHPAGSDPDFPDWSETWGDAEIREIGAPKSTETADGEIRTSQKLVLAFFRSGKIQLPPPRMATESGSSGDDSEPPEPITFLVESVLPPGEEIPEPKPPVPPVELVWGRPFWWTASLLSLATIAALALLLTRRRSDVSAGEGESIDPLAALRLALEDLRSEHDLEDAFTSLSLQLRYFLGRSLAFPAAESTTSEIRSQLRARDLPPTLVSRSASLLQQCDGIKFARQEATAGAIQSGVEEAEAIGTQTTDFLVRTLREGEEVDA